MLCALLRCCLGVIKLENITRRASDCITGPNASQRAIEMGGGRTNSPMACCFYGETHYKRVLGLLRVSSRPEVQNSSFDPKFFKIGPTMHNTLLETHINI